VKRIEDEWIAFERRERPISSALEEQPPEVIIVIAKALKGVKCEVHSCPPNTVILTQNRTV